MAFFFFLGGSLLSPKSDIKHKSRHLEHCVKSIILETYLRAWLPCTLQVAYCIHSGGFTFWLMLKLHRSSLASSLAFYCIVQYLPTVSENNIIGDVGINDGDFSLIFKILMPCAYPKEFNHISACVILTPPACSHLLPELANLS